MLLKLRDYIRKEQVVSIQQLARAFYVDAGALYPMLNLWERKGIIRAISGPSDCQSTCFKCTTQSPVYYEYCA